jgi:tellurite resistance protein TehA-like permease
MERWERGALVGAVAISLFNIALGNTVTIAIGLFSIGLLLLAVTADRYFDGRD